jgi:hypothetical protein
MPTSATRAKTAANETAESAAEINQSQPINQKIKSLKQN